MIDLHTHTFLSDGELVPAEHVRRAEVAGYRILGIADHGDFATMDSQIAAALVTARRENPLGRMIVLAGIELTHLRPAQLAEAVAMARKCGAQCVVVHGQTTVEPVEEGTNRAAIEAGADILAHPGLISPADAALAAEKGVRLEISGRQGHSLTNGHVAAVARAAGAKLIFGSDAHECPDFHTRQRAERVCLGAGLSAQEVQAMFAEAEAFARSLVVLQD
jgi:histidinol phosphatase-like PHP family hydrolase